MEQYKVAQLLKVVNAIDALGLGFLLLIGLILQIGLHELPCPLCLLQRIGLLGVAFGFLLNVQFNIHPGHYTLSLLSALLTAAISIRQVFLHVMPGDLGYGLPLFGLHLYTWVFILCVAIIIYISIILSIVTQYEVLHNSHPRSKTLKNITHLVFSVVFVLAVSNAVLTYLECGFKPCPDNPVKYEIQLVEPRLLHV